MLITAPYHWTKPFTSGEANEQMEQKLSEALHNIALKVQENKRSKVEEKSLEVWKILRDQEFPQAAAKGKFRYYWECAYLATEVVQAVRRLADREGEVKSIIKSRSGAAGFGDSVKAVEFSW